MTNSRLSHREMSWRDVHSLSQNKPAWQYSRLLWELMLDHFCCNMRIFTSRILFHTCHLISSVFKGRTRFLLTVYVNLEQIKSESLKQTSPYDMNWVLPYELHTWRRKGLSSCSTVAQRSWSMRSTTYRACTLNSELRLVTSMSSASHWPRL